MYNLFYQNSPFSQALLFIFYTSPKDLFLRNFMHVYIYINIDV
jgi:hypothetical protein